MPRAALPQWATVVLALLALPGCRRAEHASNRSEPAEVPLESLAAGTVRIISVGQPVRLVAKSPARRWSTVFEDDGETGYFYALEDSGAAPGRILDALHVYNVAAVRDRARPDSVSVRWTPDGQKAVLLINGYAHAVFDFGAHRGYNRNNFPVASDWSRAGHQWDRHALDGFGAAVRDDPAPGVT